MTRRALGLAVAVILAVLGTVALVGYVRSAEERALSDEELVEVLVVTDTIEAGSLASEIGGRVTIESEPDVPTRRHPFDRQRSPAILFLQLVPYATRLLAK